MSDYRMRSSFTPGGPGAHRSSSPALPDLPRSPASVVGTPGNPLRYSHGKMPLPNDVLRLSQQGTPNHESGRTLSAGHVSALAQRGLRPSSEMLSAGQQGTPETEVIDKWFEDLQHYEATLEEMAAASLDQNFKEELSAIEQWFRVLSEAERTAALYSLLQESTQVQIRFFITVLQQMARSDPVGAFIAPNSSSNSIGEQLESKMASLGIKTPSSVKTSSPGSRGFQRQSTGFLSPNSMSMYNSPSPEVSAAIAAQRNRLKNNRTSAPGTLPMDSMGNFTGGALDNVQEKATGAGAGSTPRERPHSIEHTAGLSRSPRTSGAIDDTRTPMNVGGSWASMVNTPIMSMLDDNQAPGGLETNAKLDGTATQLAHESDMRRPRRSSSHTANPLGAMNDASWSGDGAGGLPTSPTNMVSSPPFNNFNIPTMSPGTLAGLQSPSGGMANPTNLQMMNTMAAMGGLNNMNSTQLLALQQQILQQQQSLSGYSQGQQSRLGRTSQRGAGAVGSSVFGGPPSTPQSGQHRTLNLSAMHNRSPGSSAPAIPNVEEEVADISILNDVPAWLRHLRLHKYTPNFEGSNWREMVAMNERALEEKGVAALGARRKMLKTFEAVRHKYGIPSPTVEPASSCANTASSDGGGDADPGDDASATSQNA
ncbi:Flap-structured DNA-binding and RNA-binding protein [Malassezia sp. CBS 17886]|nr:Flap-structured DNA-binding and RNA-binding protein [Malassezia sp. CBS 17886]